MIPVTRHALIADLIELTPSLFNKTAMVGIYDGQDICSCFLNSASKLESLHFYENFHDAITVESKNHLLNKYSEWQSAIPNLTISIGDGTLLSKNHSVDFFFTDAYNIDYRSYFLDSQFDNTLIAMCGYGAAIERTVSISVCIDNRELFPVMLYNGFLFFTNSQTHYKKSHTLLKSALDSMNITYSNQLQCLRPNGWYHSLLNTLT